MRGSTGLGDETTSGPVRPPPQKHNGEDRGEWVLFRGDLILLPTSVWYRRKNNQRLGGGGGGDDDHHHHHTHRQE